MTNDDYMKLLTPLFVEAYRDGKRGEYRDAWERFCARISVPREDRPPDTNRAMRLLGAHCLEGYSAGWAAGGNLGEERLQFCSRTQKR